MKVSKAPQDTPEAYRVTIVVLNKPKSLELISELSNRIQKSLIDKLFCVSNRFSIMYFGKDLIFEIKLIETEHLADNFENLNISRNPFYKMTNKTVWKLFR